MKPLKMYRIICTITGKALVYGSDCPNCRPSYAYGAAPVWYERGHWSLSGGSFWKTDGTVKRHIQNLCHDWTARTAPSWYGSGRYEVIREMIRGSLDWSRLQHLKVETLLITTYSTVQIDASDFMGIPVSQPRPSHDCTPGAG